MDFELENTRKGSLLCPSCTHDIISILCCLQIERALIKNVRLTRTKVVPILQASDMHLALFVPYRSH